MDESVSARVGNSQGVRRRQAALRATRLMRLFTEQLAAMAKLKGKTGQQTGARALINVSENSPGRSGFGPQLSLSYDSGSGNGPFGFGWALYIPKITRKTDKGLPKYIDAEESDTYILSGGRRPGADSPR